jgi:hypothetical protein
MISGLSEEVPAPQGGKKRTPGQGDWDPWDEDKDKLTRPRKATRKGPLARGSVAPFRAYLMARESVLAAEQQCCELSDLEQLTLLSHSLRP